MSNVRADINELEIFEQHLRKASQSLSEDYARLRNHMARIDDSWKDRENRKFMEDFIPKADLIFKISEQMAEYSKFIRRKTEILKDYTR